MVYLSRLLMHVAPGFKGTLLRETIYGFENGFVLLGRKWFRFFGFRGKKWVRFALFFFHGSAQASRRVSTRQARVPAPRALGFGPSDIQVARRERFPKELEA
jgi:hypothetical protein